MAETYKCSSCGTISEEELMYPYTNYRAHCSSKCLEKTIEWVMGVDISITDYLSPAD